VIHKVWVVLIHTSRSLSLVKYCCGLRYGTCNSPQRLFTNHRSYQKRACRNLLVKSTSRSVMPWPCNN